MKEAQTRLPVPVTGKESFRYIQLTPLQNSNTYSDDKKEKLTGVQCVSISLQKYLPKFTLKEKSNS